MKIARASDPSEPLPKPRCGLRNIGNTCYANASLQCLAACAPLQKTWMESVRGAEWIDQTVSVQDVARVNGFRLSRELLSSAFYDLMSTMTVKREAIPPANLIQLLTSAFPHLLTRGDQHDAAEFITLLLDTVGTQEKWQGGTGAFRGRVLSTLRCSKCRHKTVTEEPFLLYGVPINEFDDLEKALQSTQTEVPVEEQQQCLSCGMISIKSKCPANRFKSIEQRFKKDALTPEDKVDIRRFSPGIPVRHFTRTAEILHAPAVLAVHLLRFSAEKKRIRGVVLNKDSHDVDVPLNMVLGTVEGAVEYVLRGVVLHTGRLRRGHYTALCAHGDPAHLNWMLYDDSKVTMVDKSAVLNKARKNGYIAIYVRSSDVSLPPMLPEDLHLSGL